MSLPWFVAPDAVIDPDHIPDGILYLLFGAVPIVYEENRGWNPLVGSLPFLAVLVCSYSLSFFQLPGAYALSLAQVGTLTAAMVNIYYSSHVFAPYLEKHGGRAPPERRLPPMSASLFSCRSFPTPDIVLVLGAVTFPVGFFLLGWTSDPSINWFPSVLGLAFIGMRYALFIFWV